MSLLKAYLIIFVILVVDQVSKIFVKTNFILGEEMEVFSWFNILFIENEGMAWGTKIPGEYGKIILTVFRIFAVGGIGYWLWYAVQRKHSPTRLIIAIALIFAGAMGNIIDSIFYGVLFNDSTSQLATLFSDHPYGEFFYGKVVDMFYFPFWHGFLPNWLPIYGGKECAFFSAIFNVADIAISTGVGILIIFNKKAFQK